MSMPLRTTYTSICGVTWGDSTCNLMHLVSYNKCYVFNCDVNMERATNHSKVDR